ncbi:MAG TPA: M14 family zinc carboxypeptidase [Kofleriaceae bacterium]|nr:M14 family zinc carboxypeptidase [Kofleriaceae bacterium]
MSRALVGLLFCSLVACTHARPKLELVTTAERTQYVRTGRYDEAVQLCRDFARVYESVTCSEIGKTGEDRPIVALAIAKHTGLPVIYIEGGIHAGEIEGKDAGFAILRDLLDGKLVPGALDAVSVVFVPVINPDGHERISPNNRPNQRGPAEMGFRTNGARQNVNRDWVKADTPEAQAVLRVLRDRDPVMLIDLHTTDGAKFEHDISINVAPVADRADSLDDAAHALRDGVVARLTQLGHLPVDFYPSFVDDEDPKSGFAIGEAPPRFSQAYMAARGRLGILVETHSWRTYKERAQSTYHALQAVFELAVKDARRWREAADAAAIADARLGGTKLPITWKSGPHVRPLAFRGYKYEIKPSEISGGKWIVYDEKSPEIWNVPLKDTLVPAIEIDVPRGGYVIDGGFAKLVAAILERHGLSYTPIAGQPTLEVDAYRATKTTYQPPFEGRTRVAIEGAWKPERRTLDRGAIFVPIAQPYVRVILHLLEPALPDSLAQWGFFNACFEQKEYMEPYVAEEVARAMLAADPALKQQFDAALAADPELAKTPIKRLQWFYQRHPSWDERVNLLPVYRTSQDLRSR